MAVVAAAGATTLLFSDATRVQRCSLAQQKRLLRLKCLLPTALRTPQAAAMASHLLATFMIGRVIGRGVGVGVAIAGIAACATLRG